MNTHTSTPITLPEKLTRQQAVRLFTKYMEAPVNQIVYFQDHLLRDLAEILKPVDKWAKEKEAFAQGKKIEYRNRSLPNWIHTSTPLWIEGEGHEYRIAPDEPWTPKVGDWVKPINVYHFADVYEIGSFDGHFYCKKGNPHIGFREQSLRLATAEEIAAAKAKIRADKLFEEERKHAERVRQIEEECK